MFQFKLLHFSYQCLAVFSWVLVVKMFFMNDPNTNIKVFFWYLTWNCYLGTRIRGSGSFWRSVKISTTPKGKSKFLSFNNDFSRPRNRGAWRRKGENEASTKRVQLFKAETVKKGSVLTSNQNKTRKREEFTKKFDQAHHQNLAKSNCVNLNEAKSSPQSLEDCHLKISPNLNKNFF
jgi:hypothetical protein